MLFLRKIRSGLWPLTWPKNFFAACKAARKAKEKYAAANKATDAYTFEFFAACKAAGIFVSLTQRGNQNRRFKQVLTWLVSLLKSANHATALRPSTSLALGTCCINLRYATTYCAAQKSSWLHDTALLSSKPAKSISLQPCWAVCTEIAVNSFFVKTRSTYNWGVKRHVEFKRKSISGLFL